MNYWAISDTHFGHKSITKLCNRPFSSVEEMDQTMIDNWNRVVSNNDIVYHLGDMFWSEKSAINILPQLNGHILLILGNHDRNWKRVRSRLEIDYGPGNGNKFSVCTRDIHRIDDPVKAILCHYPLMSWDGAFHGRLHFHGHTHRNGCLSEGNRYNVSVENINYTPVNLSTFKNKGI